MKKLSLFLLGLTASFSTQLLAQKASSELVNTIKDRIKVSAYAQTGMSSTFASKDGEKDQHSFLVRRVELSVKAKINEQWSFAYTGDMNKGHKMKDFYVEYSIMPELGLRVGQYKTAFSIENNISSSVNELILGGSRITRYLAASDASDQLMGNQNGRDIGLELRGDLFDRIVSYRLGMINGQGINKLDLNNAKSLDASLIVRPLTNLSFMASTLVGKTVAVSEIEGVVAKADEYKRNRWALGLTFKAEIADFRSEYLSGMDADLHTSGFYSTAIWHAIPKLDFIASYDFFKQTLKKTDSHIDFTPLAHNFTAGLQYFFYPKCRLQLQYGNWDGINVLNTQVQIGF